MRDYIAWYLVELEVRLKSRIPAPQIETILKETESHLREAIRSREERDHVSPETATLAAIASFGSADRVAASYLAGQNSPADARAKWTVIIAAAIATVCWDYQWMSLGGFFDNFGETWLNFALGILGLAALGAMVRASRARFRSSWKALTGLSLGMAVGSFFLLSFWIVGSTGYQGFNRFHLGRDVATAHRSLETLDDIERYVTTGSQIFANAQSFADVPIQYRDRSLVERAAGLPSNDLKYYQTGIAKPGESMIAVPRSVFALVDGRIWAFELHPATLTKAKQEWREAAPASLTSIEEARKAFEGLLVAADQAYSGRIFFFNPKVYGDPMFWTVIFLPVLLIADGLATLSQRRRTVSLRSLA